MQKPDVHLKTVYDVVVFLQFIHFFPLNLGGFAVWLIHALAAHSDHPQELLLCLPYP